MKSATIYTGLVFLLLGSACSPYQVRSLDRPEVIVPGAYHHAIEGKQLIGEWWKEFGEAGLNKAIEVTLAENLELRQVWDRLAQALAQARIEGADLWPHLDLNTGASRTRTVDRDAINPLGHEGTRTDSLENYLVFTGLSYEVDLWKRIASQRQAAQLEYQATRQDVEETALLLTGFITDVWFTIQEQKALLALLAEQVQVSQTLLDLTELRFSVGAGSAVDVLQQRQQLAATESEIPVAQSFLNTSLNQLAVLLGQAPGSLDDFDPYGLLPDLPPFPQLGSPATLLTARPDLRAAQLRLQAADYRVAAAVAERMPRLALSLSYEFSARSWSTFFRQEIGSVASDLFAPLVDGGRRRNEVLRRKARTQELLDRFGQTYLDALLEIEDALVREHYQLNLIESLDTEIALAEATLRESRSRYIHGLIDYLTVLVTVQSLQALQRRMISEQKALLSIRAGLYRALGGKWLEAVEVPSSLWLAQAQPPLRGTEP